MKSNKFGVAIIGCGIISDSHIQAYEANNDRCEIKAVCDLIPEKASQLASSINKEVMVYTDIQELLRREDIDIISICTPPFAHVNVAIAALKAGKHVLCEKPLAASLEECDEIIEAAKKYKRKLAVCFQYRFRKDFNQIKHLINSKSLDKLTFGQLNGLYWRGDSYYDVDWRGRWKTECGGVTINHEIHMLDIFLWLMGEVDSVSAEIDTISHNIEVEDVSMAVIRFANGAIGQVNGTVSSAITDVTMNISGIRKGVSIPLKFHAVKENENGFPVVDHEGVTELKKKANEICTGTNDHTGPVNDLLKAIINDEEPFVNGEEGRRVVEVITAIYKSGSTGQRVQLPINKSDPWYTTVGLQSLVKKGAERNIV